MISESREWKSVRIIVLLKDIVDLAELKIDPSTRRPQVAGVKRRISDVDKRALEAAIRLKEKHGGEVVAVSMGDEKTRTTMLEALAMGADLVYVINDKALIGLDTLATSIILVAAIKKIGTFDIILCGEMTLDSLSSQVGPRIAEILDLPQITYARSIDLRDNRLIAIRDLDDMDEVVEAELPVVVSAVREIAEPRIPSLMSIMKAKSKPMTEWNATSPGFSSDEVKAFSSVEVLSVEAPLVERKHIIIHGETVEEVSEKLAKAILAEGVVER